VTATTSAGTPTTPEQIRRRIEGWLAVHDQAMLDRLRQDPAGSAILTQAAAGILGCLSRAATVRADPACADPAQGDEFYLMDHPQGLTEALVENLAGDEDYWLLKLRWPPEQPTEPQESPAE